MSSASTGYKRSIRNRPKSVTVSGSTCRRRLADASVAMATGAVVDLMPRHCTICTETKIDTKITMKTALKVANMALTAADEKRLSCNLSVSDKPNLDFDTRRILFNNVAISFSGRRLDTF